MDDLVDEAVDRLDQERSGGTRSNPVVALDRLGGGYILCPVDSLVVRDNRGRFGLNDGEWIGSDRLVETREVR